MFLQPCHLNCYYFLMEMYVCRRIQLHDLHHASWSGCLHLQTTFSSSSYSSSSWQIFDLQFKEKFFLEPALGSFWFPPHHTPNQVHASFGSWPHLIPTTSFKNVHWSTIFYKPQFFFCPKSTNFVGYAEPPTDIKLQWKRSILEWVHTIYIPKDKK